MKEDIVFGASWSRLLDGTEKPVIESGDAVLAATLALPRWGGGPFPAAVIVHGSGRVTRRDLRAYAGQVVPQGMAVLIYDKRGVGESTGRFWLASGSCNPIQKKRTSVLSVRSVVRISGSAWNGTDERS